MNEQRGATIGYYERRKASNLIDSSPSPSQSDATIVFLSDMFPSLPPTSSRFTRMLAESSRPPPSVRWIKLLVSLFSSSYSVFDNSFLTRLISLPFSFCVRFAINFYNRLLSFLHRNVCPLRKIPNILVLPTLRSSRHWATKNTMLSAMTFILSCTSRGLQTCPMEGFNQRGLLSALDVSEPWRYEAAMIVSVGKAYNGEASNEDDVGMAHPDPRGLGGNSTPRFSLDSYLLSSPKLRPQRP
ncbi:hypothetical protein TrCOL_g7045 [Triparma columacea]|uniref:Nitroreductase domain-containing protein n=1 Tax=Triparma columacea TaxID=722753 RepID=A0A9W7G1V5_9STRA|nr:hypothetical protein TrCOL_g7045 [Triparma columacea]